MDATCVNCAQHKCSYEPERHQIHSHCDSLATCGPNDSGKADSSLQTAEIVQFLRPQVIDKSPTESTSSPGTVISSTRSLQNSSGSNGGLDMASQWLARRATLLGWFDHMSREPGSQYSATNCVAVKRPEGGHSFCPPDVNPTLASAITTLNEAATIAMSSQITTTVISNIDPGQRCFVAMTTSDRIPIVLSLGDVDHSITQFSRACIVMEERLVLVWAHDVTTVLNVAHDVETQLGSQYPKTHAPSSAWLSGRSSIADIPRSDQGESVKANGAAGPNAVRGALDENHRIYSKAVALEEGLEDDELDLERNTRPRPVLLVHTLKISLAIMLVIVTQCLGISRLLNEYLWDGGYTRFALVSFFFIVLVTSVFQLFLPAKFCLKNSKYHSAVKPNPKAHRNYELPHITIQMPVYKEGLKSVIVPTMISVLAAVQYYENQGGTASVFVNDDGMQVIQPELAEARKQYYRENGIGYTARLPNRRNDVKKSFWFEWFRKSKPITEEKYETESPVDTQQALANKVGFERKGRFKKASNMNYGLSFSLRVEDEMARLVDLEVQRRGCGKDDLTVEDDDELYKQALHNMLVADEGAEGNIRIGELILLIDSDTRVPVDCLLYGALELHESPEVAILQHGSGVMQVVHNTFENGITYFTNVVYTAIKYGVGSGDVAPFVGHNAFIRWKALQSIQFVDPSDGQTKWWSDSHVSEDFDVSLRCQTQGMVVRLATYHDGEFKEGVSLTLYDELNRWEKYAYGCNELVFHPCYQWFYKGPVTRLFLRFLWSNIPVTSKVTILAYIFTYYAMAAGMLLSTVNYIVVGLFNDDIDHLYLPSWGIWCSLVVVFNGFGSLAFSMARHQLEEETFWRALMDIAKWLPFLIIYFGGISLNCAKAILCHAFSIDLEWAATAKEIGPTGFYIGMDKMVQKFKWTWAICLLLTGVMIYFAVGAPWGWTITPGAYSTATVAIAPLAIQICSSAFLPFFLGLN
ncbi:glycosyl transferase family group 2-domain-containing protein [Aspergillus ambiguus]|uniref:uncharacterized protein n=1 Tax=Aspergillus ambiguus TaxID=176160 RepID=UPI003CCE0946